MKDYLKVYKAKLRVLSPTFVGNGKDISKKEYSLSSKDQKVIIYDPGKFYQLMQNAGKAQKYEDYLLSDNRNKLDDWMRFNRVSVEDVKDAVRYSIACGDRMEKDLSRISIMEFVKDPYGKPFVPGTSIKGMLRTILLDYEILKNRNKYEAVAEEIKKYNRNERRNTAYLSLSKEIERITFNSLKRDGVDDSNAVNDIMQGFIVSDSKPLALDNLVLCQKIEYHLDKSKKPLNILRECLRPGTDIEFTITIDTQLCKYDQSAIMKAIEKFNQMYYEYYLSKFGSKQKPADNVFLGGGVGFVSKTFIYSLFGDKGVSVADNVFRKTLTPKIYFEHGHKHDVKRGVSPHILKCTLYNGSYLQMGVCRFEMTEIVKE